MSEAGDFARLETWTPRPAGRTTAITRCADTGSFTLDPPVEADAPPFGPLDLPGFTIQGELGRGGMGIVYRAVQLSPHREVALKVLPPMLARDPHRLRQYRTEAAVAARLTNSHILPVLEVLEFQDLPILVFPYVDGTDLGRIIHDRRAMRQGRWPRDPHAWATVSDRDYLDQVVPLLDQLVEAVAVIHRVEVLHRDIKPANVLVDHGGHLWLTDFGCARLGQPGLDTDNPGLVVGTPGFMSPEQVRGAEDLDSQCDIFGLGVTLYAALTLRLPYGTAGTKPGDWPPCAPSQWQPLVAEDLDLVVLKALEPHRQHRYASAVELGQDWRRARQRMSPRADPLGPAG